MSVTAMEQNKDQMSVSTHSVLRGEEPPMFLHRPSSSRSQDVAHLLAATFRELFTREPLSAEKVAYLHRARGGEDSYHENYVAALQKVQNKRERRMAEAAMLERHIMQAQARAMSADERLLKRKSAQTNKDFPDIGLPPPRSHFRCCIDSELMRKYKLITPEDFVSNEKTYLAPPTVCSEPNYAALTKSTEFRRTATKDSTSKRDSPFPTMPQDDNDDTSSFHSESEININFPEPKVRSAPARLGRRLWHNEPDAEMRLDNKRCLAKMESCVNYLRNPRHELPAKGAHLLVPQAKFSKQIQPIPPAISDKAVPIFLPSPPELVFTMYTVGQVYEMTLELKNVTTVLRPVRLIPPRTPFFTASLGLFPNRQGLVAPGMSCYYKIRFAPDSLCDFDDQVVVQTQAANPIVIPLQGRRPPPVLTISSTFAMGECLVGGMKVGHFVVVNEGGPGRFCMLATSSWPAANFKTVVSMPQVCLPPFEVRPSMFQLLAGQSTVIEVIFCPMQLQSYTQNITIVCDNCQVKKCQITGIGATVNVDVNPIDDCFSERDPAQLYDLTAKHLICFDILNPFVFVQKTFVVTNSIDVELMYNWVIVKPHILPPYQTVDDSAVIPSERQQEETSVFTVEPQEGVLQGNESVEFCVTFAPTKVGRFHNVLHMIMRNIPNVESSEQLSTSASDSDIILKKCKSSGTADVKLEDLTVVEVEMIGDCEPFAVSLQPYAVLIPGQILMETSIRKHLVLINSSITSIIFQWEKICDDDCILEVEPHIAEIAAQSEMHLELTISGSRPGKIDRTLFCYIQHMEEPITLQVQAEILGPEVIVANPDLNFGLVELGDQETLKLSIENLSRICAKWSICESTTHVTRLDNSMAKSDFTFEPCEGELRPLEESFIAITFKPSQQESLRTVFELEVENGNKCFVSVRAEVQSPQVCLMSCELNMTDLYQSVPVRYTVTLFNQTLLPTTFKWGKLTYATSLHEVSNDQAADAVTTGNTYTAEDLEKYVVSLEPNSGEIGPREKIDINVDFNAAKPGILPELRLPCVIGSMEKPLSLALFGEVKGHHVLFRCTENEEEEDEGWVDMGDNLPLGADPTHHIFIINKTAIPTEYSLHFTQLPAFQGSDVSKPAETMRSRLLGRTPNLANPLSKTVQEAHKDWCRSMLKTGFGAAFMVTPSSGILQPYEKLRVQLQGFNDMWGVYQDTLLCKMLKPDGEETTEIDVSMSVDGCPLYFQMMSAEPQGPTPMLRFGTLMCGAQPVTRQMKINNSSSIDIRLDWKTFNTEKRPMCQLLDFIVTYGDIFPLKDSKGNEIAPPKEVVEGRSLDFIPNTPDSSLLPSRQLTKLDLLMNEDRPKIVSVNLTSHLGEKSSTPFSIWPTQLMIPAKGYNYINVTFTPPNHVDEETEFTGFADGYMSLDGKESLLHGMIERPHQYDVPPMKLNLLAVCKPPRLTIECAEDDQMHYEMTASDLIHNGQVMDETSKLNRFTLSNRTETPLVFDLCTKQPFPLVVGVKTDGAKRQSLLHKLKTEKFTLHPQENMLVTVAFRLMREALTKPRKHHEKKKKSRKSEPEVVEDVTADVGVPENVEEVAPPDENVQEAVEPTEPPQPPTEPAVETTAEVEKPETEEVRKEAATTENGATAQQDTEEQPPGGEGQEKENGKKEGRQEEEEDDGMKREEVKEDGISQDVLIVEDEEEAEDAVSALGRMIRFQKDLVITFNNGTTQTLPLTASVVLPSFSLSKRHIDFGTCLVGQRRSAELILSNTTQSACLWTMRPERISDLCVDDTFEISPQDGVLDANINFDSQNKVLLVVTFMAKHSEAYEIEYVIRGIFGEQPMSLTCSGQGSYDECYEAVLNT